jgi:hypothetical protein
MTTILIGVLTTGDRLAGDGMSSGLLGPTVGTRPLAPAGGSWGDPGAAFESSCARARSGRRRAPAHTDTRTDTQFKYMILRALYCKCGSCTHTVGEPG